MTTITAADHAWLMDPDNASGFPALYECRACKAVFRWFRVNGDAGKFCQPCEKIVYDSIHPREIAHFDKFGYWQAVSTTVAKSMPAMRASQI